MPKYTNSLPLKPVLSAKEELEKARDSSNNITLPNSERNKQQDFWKDFKDYLIAQKQSKSSIRNKVGYAQRFYYILETKDAQDILKLSHGSKSHTMKALASLSKFLGKYDLWLDIIKKYQLKWGRV